MNEFLSSLEKVRVALEKQGENKSKGKPRSKTIHALCSERLAVLEDHWKKSQETHNEKPYKLLRKMSARRNELKCVEKKLNKLNVTITQLKEELGYQSGDRDGMSLKLGAIASTHSHLIGRVNHLKADFTTKENEWTQRLADNHSGNRNGRNTAPHPSAIPESYKRRSHSQSDQASSDERSRSLDKRTSAPSSSTQASSDKRSRSLDKRKSAPSSSTLTYKSWDKSSTKLEWHGILPKNMRRWNEEEMIDLDGVTREMIDNLASVSWNDPNMADQFVYDQELRINVDEPNRGTRAALAYRRDRSDGTISCLYVLVTVKFQLDVSAWRQYAGQRRGARGLANHRGQPSEKEVNEAVEQTIEEVFRSNGFQTD